MNRYLAILRPWTWPVLVSVAVVTGFATPGSDLPAAALWLSAVFAALACAAFLFDAAAQPGLFQRPAVRNVAIALGIFVIAVFVPLLVAALKPLAIRGMALYDPSAALLESLKLAGVLCAFWLGLCLSHTDDRARRLFDALLYAGGLWAVASIFMFILDPAGIYGEMKFGAGRLTGAFSSPNSAGTLFGALAVMAMGRVVSRFLMRTDTQVIERIDPLMTMVCVVSLAALMLTVSRGALFAVIISGVGLALVLLRGRVSLPMLAGVCLAGVLGLAVLFATPLAGVVGRLESINGDAAVRLTILKSHFTFAGHQPLFGTGLGSFNTINNHIISADDYTALSLIRTMHNVYLQWFEETGAAGLLALAGLNLAVLAPMVMAARRRPHMAGRLWAILGGYAVFLLHGFTDYAFQEPALVLFIALILGCGFGIAGNRSPEGKKIRQKPAAENAV
ncbi:MAG TPA: O-antigen ligase family protein [Asticcacaulis sp.]|nr:O-antigen ligase family protein [Asticcacaulis sp.]